MKSKNKAFDHGKYADWIDPNAVIPYEKNAKKHDDKQVANIANSIRRFGWQQDTVITADNVLVIGHGRRLAALKLGCEMPYHRIDKNADELTDKDIRELRLADNLTNSQTGYDFDLMHEDVADLDFEGFEFDLGLEEAVEEAENKYTQATNIPQYEPTGEDVSFGEMVNTIKANTLAEDINASSVTDEEKQFLLLAAARHNVFNYKKIAEYYAQATPEMQRLMEASALVIIDLDNAIANGYARLSAEIGELLKDE